MNKKTDDFNTEWRETVKDMSKMIFDVQSFISATIKFKEPIGPGDNQDLRVRAIEVKGDTLWQFVKTSESVNLSRGEAMKTLLAMLREKPVDEAHVMTADQDLHCRISKKGRVLVSRSKGTLGRDPEKTRAHDREKDYPLTRFDSAKLLIVLGIADSTGSIKPSMNAKYRQVNEFLRILDTTFGELKNCEGREVRIVDIGCGKSYLSFSAKAFLEATRGATIRLTGIDWNEKIVASCRRMAESMDWNYNIEFLSQDVATYKPEIAPDIVLSLHACDKATDEALAFGVEHSASAILCAPCCQHELQTKMGSTGPNRAILSRTFAIRKLKKLFSFQQDAFPAHFACF